MGERKRKTIKERERERGGSEREREKDEEGMIIEKEIKIGKRRKDVCVERGRW